MFSPEADDKSFEPRLNLKSLRGIKSTQKRKWSYKTSDEEDAGSSHSNVTRNSLGSIANTSHPALNHDKVNAHSTPEEILNRSKSRKRSIRSGSQFVNEQNLSINNDEEDVQNEVEEQLSGQVNMFNSTTDKDSSKSKLTLEIAAQCLDVKLSTEQLAAHLASCIEMNAANKINKKNAFSLQLIDYMVILLKRNDKTMKDFPTMSCSLDASTRIYACRVDNVHAGVMGIVTGLAGAIERHRKNKSKAAEGSDADNSEKEGGKGGGVKKRKRKAVIVSSRDTIRRNCIVTANWMKRRTVQPDFTCLLNLATITQAPESSLSVPKDNIPLVQTVREPPVYESKRIKVDMPDLPKDKLLFSSKFSFVWDENSPVGGMDTDDHEISQDDVSFGAHDNTLIEGRPAHQAQMDITCEKTIENVNCSISNVNVDNDTDVENDFAGPPSFHDDDDDDDMKENVKPVIENAGERAAGMSKQRRTDLDTLSIVSSKAVQSADHSLYSYIDSDLLPNLWVGPEHWKPKLKRGKPNHVAAEVAEKRAEKKNKKGAFQLVYDDFSTADSTFKRKLNIKLPYRITEKWSEKKITLPHRIELKMETKYSSFLRNTVFYKPYLKQEAKDANESEVKTELEFADSAEHLFEDTKLENKNLLEFNDLSDADDGGSVQDNVSDYGDFADPDSRCAQDGIQSLTQSNTSNIFEANNLVPVPHLVDCGKINYATVPKRLDMKKLKRTVWYIMDIEGGDKENVNSNKVVDEQVTNKKPREVHFSSIFKQLPNMLPDDMWNDMSPALVFLSVLHLANEKTLKVKSLDRERMEDIVIEKDEQID